jgi:hypothetical protein
MSVLMSEEPVENMEEDMLKVEESNVDIVNDTPIFDRVKNILVDTRVGYHTYITKPKVEAFSYGWFWPAHEIVFKCLLPEEPKILLELGSFLGRSVTHVLSKYPNALVFAADYWDNERLKQDAHYKAMDQRIIATYPLYETFLVNTWQYRLRVSNQQEFYGLVPMRMRTIDAIHLLHSHGITPDFIYVDASHYYNEVKADIEACLDLFPKAAMCGDDYNFEDVRRAVDEVASQRGFRVTVEGQCWTYGTLDETVRREAQREIESATRTFKKQKII